LLQNIASRTSHFSFASYFDTQQKVHGLRLKINLEVVSSCSPDENGCQAGTAASNDIYSRNPSHGVTLRNLDKFRVPRFHNTVIPGR
jgi:hypothetical protein